MKIIISPAKKMNEDVETLEYRRMPHFIKETEEILDYLKTLNYAELKSIWKCNDSIAEQNYKRIQDMDLQKRQTPCILSYEGIQYTYMAPKVLESAGLEYLEEHLRILSGFYGLLRPFDGVVPYRLEMQSILKGWNPESLYHFWKGKLANELWKETDCIVNLASKEYSKCITPYLQTDTRFITCVFGELHNGKVIEKGTYAKMARGEMVRFMAEEQIKNIRAIKEFGRFGYVFTPEKSNEDTYVFIKQTNHGYGSK